jgi:hypothetical protein
MILEQNGFIFSSNNSLTYLINKNFFFNNTASKFEILNLDYGGVIY